MNRPPDRPEPDPGSEPSGWAAPGQDPRSAPGQAPPPGYGAPPPPGYSGPPPGYGPPQGYGAPPGPGWGPPRPTGGSARTGPLPLHPMTVGDILDGAFKLMKGNARAIAVIVAVFVVPVSFLAAFAQRDALSFADLFSEDFGDPSVWESGDPFAGSGVDVALTTIATLVDLLTTPFVAGAVSAVVAAAYLGRELGPGEALRRAFGRFWALLLSWFLVKLAQISGFVVVGLLAGALALAGAPDALMAVLLIVGLPLAFATIFVVMGYSVLVAPAIVVERLGAVAGIRRSWGLVRRRFWPVLGTALLAGILAAILGFVLGVVPTAVSFVAGDWEWVINAVGAAIVAIATEPIVAIVATLLYFDARIRREGFDLQVIATELSGDRGPIS